jgi:protein-tyrosine phosphatase
MVKILFVCHGNICRSPMAEFAMKDLAAKEGLSSQFYVSSAATSSEEIGNPVYPPARQILEEHGIRCTGKTAQKLCKKDYADYDLLIGMDEENLSRMKTICDGDPEEKMNLLLDFTAHRGPVADPWYTRDFETTWEQVQSGCKGLLGWLWYTGRIKMPQARVSAT